MLEIAPPTRLLSGVYLIKLSGELDHSTAGEFLRFFDRQIQDGKTLLLFDAFDLRAVSSGGLGALFQLSETLHEQEGIAFVGINHELKLLFSFSGLNRRIPSFASIRDAEHHLVHQIVSTPGRTVDARSILASEGEVPSTFDPFDRAGAADHVPLESDSNVIVCEQCHANLRVPKTGNYMCPSCSIHFHVKRDGSVAFFEKLEK